ncbi:MAG: hemolysin III family protein [Planctomycetota bacterium]|nr:hemolysin III family protein [Planctomycetota bacterium]
MSTTSTMKINRDYSAREEVAHAVTHGFGAALSVAGLVLLILRAVENGSAIHVVSFTVFGTSAVLLYSASTIYHAFANTKYQRLLKVVDHSLIYVLIAGSYTPFLLVGLKGSWGWSLFGVVWGLTIIGIVFKVFYAGRFKLASTLLYLGLGWMCVIAVKPMLANVPAPALWWLFAGGMAYSLGTVFYMRKRMVYHHAVWHVFVLAGTTCHFQAVYGYLAPAV